MILDDEIMLDFAQCVQLLEVLRDNQSMLVKMKEREGADFKQAKRSSIRDLVQSETWLSAAREALRTREGPGTS